MPNKSANVGLYSVTDKDNNGIMIDTVLIYIIHILLVLLY